MKATGNPANCCSGESTALDGPIGGLAPANSRIGGFLPHHGDAMLPLPREKMFSRFRVKSIDIDLSLPIVVVLWSQAEQWLRSQLRWLLRKYRVLQGNTRVSADFSLQLPTLGKAFCLVAGI